MTDLCTSRSNCWLRGRNEWTPTVLPGVLCWRQQANHTPSNDLPAIMSHVAVFDTKPYDREHLQKAAAESKVKWHFLDFRLTRETAPMANGARAVCVFVNDQLDRHCLEALAGQGVKLIALRCAGFNNVDIEAARELKLGVTRVPIYSPYAVAEHAAALLLALNRKIHRAFNRVREFNFSLNGLVGFDLYGKTAGIVGTGKTGRIVGEILRGFGMRVLAF